MPLPATITELGTIDFYGLVFNDASSDLDVNSAKSAVKAIAPGGVEHAFVVTSVPNANAGSLTLSGALDLNDISPITAGQWEIVVDTTLTNTAPTPNTLARQVKLARFQVNIS